MLLGIGVTIVLWVVLPEVLRWYSYTKFKALFYEQFGLSDTTSGALAGFFTAAATISWTGVIEGILLWFVRREEVRRDLAYLVIAFAVAFATGIAHFVLGDPCFNQRTGESRKWYTIQPDGRIDLADSAGHDPNYQTTRRVATAKICRIVDLQKRGVRPQRITADARTVKFFHDLSGAPLVWYYRTNEDGLELFDAEGINPHGGEPLLAITAEVAEEARGQAVAAERAHKVRAEEEARQKLADLFGVAAFPQGAILVATATAREDSLGTEAAKQLWTALAVALQAKGFQVEDIKPAVRASRYFPGLMAGETTILSEVGLLPKTRGVVLGMVREVSCRPVESIGMFNCTIGVELQLVSPDGRAASRPGEGRAVGTDASAAAAIARAVAQIFKDYPKWLDGM